jgi:hypothetical protein
MNGKKWFELEFIGKVFVALITFNYPKIIKCTAGKNDQTEFVERTDALNQNRIF